MRLAPRATAAGLLASTAGIGGSYVLLVRGSLTLDLGLGRRLRPLGPIADTIAAPPETVFDVIAGPYLGRTPRAMQDKLRASWSAAQTWWWPSISATPGHWP